MRSIAAIALGIIATACASVSAPVVRDQILRNEKALNDAWLRHDVDGVSQYFDDGWSEVTRKGKVLTKADIKAAVAMTGDSETETLVSDQVVTPHGDFAIHTARIIDKGRKTSGEQYAVETRILNVWVRRNGRWRIIASQTIFVTPRP
jgi:ketosteroid isomerase-like protein